MLNCGTHGTRSTNCIPASPFCHQTNSRHETANVARLTSSAHHFWSFAPGRASRISPPTNRQEDDD